MGTEVQSKMYLQGYYSLMDLNNDSGKGSWHVHSDQKTLQRNGQYHEIFLSRPVMDGYDGHDKEVLRQTILKHETLFRHQLCELHRLYKIQRDLMNDIKSKSHKHLILAGTSQSNPFPSEDEKKRWHISSLSLDYTYGRPATRSVDIIPSHFNPEEGKIMQSSCGHTQSGVRQKDHESLEPKSGKLQRRLFDLEIPADEYMESKGEEQKDSGDLREQSYPPNSFIAHKREENLSISIGVSSSCSADAFSSSVHLRKAPGLADLNATIQVEEACASAILGNNTSSKEEVQRQDSSPSTYSSLQCLAKEFSPNLDSGSGRAVRKLRFSDDGKQQDQLSYMFEAGKNRHNGSSLCGSFHPEDSPKHCESSQVETMRARDPATYFPSDQNKTEQQIKRKIFGIEIPETNHNSSVVASCSLGPQTSAVSKCDVADCKSFAISPWIKPPGSLSQHSTSTQGSLCFMTSPQSNKSSITLNRSSEVTGELLTDSNSKSIPATRAAVSYQNDVYRGSKLVSNDIHGCQPSGHLGILNGINDRNFTFQQFQQHEPPKYLTGSGNNVEVKPAKKVDMDTVTVSNQCKVICEENLISVDWSRTQENSQGVSSWQRAMPKCNGKYSGEKEGRDHKNSCSTQFLNRTEMIKSQSLSFTHDSLSVTCGDDLEHGKIDIGNCSSTMKILGFPIIDKPHDLKDLPSHSSPSKHGCLGSQDPMSPRSGELPKVEGLAVAKGLVDHCPPSRRQIDLNICITEEEVLSTPSSAIATQIDLEAPLVTDTEIGITPKEGSPESKNREPFATLQDESRMPHEGHIRLAAEALVSISSFHVLNLASHAVDNLQEDAASHQSGASLTDSLYLLAEIISSDIADTENEVVGVLTDKDTSFQEELTPDGVDFFEFMTLNLTESKVENSCYVAWTSENRNTENILRRRPRRGQSRRGRQRKDFQRDILPSLTSLSRNEVTEDLQTIEGLVKATGGTWQSSLAYRNSTKPGGGRGRRRKVVSVPPPTAPTGCLPVVQPPECTMPALKERSLAGWGKRTRRPSRQRCLINNPPVCLQ